MPEKPGHDSPCASGIRFGHISKPREKPRLVSIPVVTALRDVHHIPALAHLLHLPAADRLRLSEIRGAYFTPATNVGFGTDAGFEGGLVILWSFTSSSPVSLIAVATPDDAVLPGVPSHFGVACSAAVGK